MSSFFSDLPKRLLFVIVALLVFRIGTYVPAPGVDHNSIRDLFDGDNSGIMSMFNVFSGGALSRMGIFALTIMPYITSSIVFQLLSITFTSISDLKKEGEYGRSKINFYTKILTLFLALFQGASIAFALDGFVDVVDHVYLYKFSTIITFVAGTVFLVWLGERVTLHGVGNGVSIIVFSGIVSVLPSSFVQFIQLGKSGIISGKVVFSIVFISFFVMFLVVFVERSFRKIFVHYPKHNSSYMGKKKAFDDSNNYIPLKVNAAGIIPPIFASALILFPLTIVSFINSNGGDNIFLNAVLYLSPGNAPYLFFNFVMIFFFAVFYSGIVFNVSETAENLKKNNSFIPGYRPGKHTEEYLKNLLLKVSIIGGVYLSCICVIPELFKYIYNVNFVISGAGVLIVVNVIMDTVSSVQARIFSKQYDQVMKKAWLKGKLV